MKITYCGQSAVDIAGVSGVEPGAEVDVPAELAEALLFAGTEVLEDGTAVPPITPQWVASVKKPAKAGEGA